MAVVRTVWRWARSAKSASARSIPLASAGADTASSTMPQPPGSSASTTVSSSPPTGETIGSAPYAIAYSCPSPHGSNRDGIRKKSAAA